MRKSQHTLLLTLCIFLFSSCATILHSKVTNIHIVTKQPAHSVVNGDSTSTLSKERYIVAERSRKPLPVTIYNDSLQKVFQLPSKNSFAYWLNLYPVLWPGFFIDLKNPKRFTYPGLVFVDLEDTTTQYLPFIPLENPYSSYTNVLKITPLKILGLINPAVEISYERFTGNNFSTQVMASYLLPRSIFDSRNDINPHIRGFRTSLEERYYFKRSAPLGPYVGFEINFLQNRYRQSALFFQPGPSPDSSFIKDYYPDTFGIRKQTISGSFKIGYQKIHKRFVIDVYVGLGLKYKNAVHFARQNPTDIMASPRHPNIYHISSEEGKLWTASTPMNIKVGWLF